MSFTKINYTDNETIITADNLNNIQDAILEGYQPDGTIEVAHFAPNAIVEAVYPIGSIYMSVNGISPASQFGGTWEQIKDRFILAAGNSYTAGATGGEAAVTLVVNQIPNHNHRTTAGGGSANIYYTSGGSSAWLQSSGFGETYSDWTGTTGGSQAHNNMPPYLVAYMWKRIA